MIDDNTEEALSLVNAGIKLLNQIDLLERKLELAIKQRNKYLDLTECPTNAEIIARDLDKIIEDLK